ncbi:mitochondrial glycoprotein [Lipomyces japonicus]|uniref:mitochondrial glycoprotein n=1 Tax=Lipomyces japonicus TaxID=56871 RepID=UPI0034CEF0DC
MASRLLISKNICRAIRPARSQVCSLTAITSSIRTAQPHAIRAFTTTQVSLARENNAARVDPKRGLVKALASEIKFEENDKHDDDSESLLLATNFKIAESDKADKVILESEYEDETIVVTFVPSDVEASDEFGNDSFDEEYHDEQEASAEEDEVDDSGELESLEEIPVKVYITKPDAGTLVIDGLASNQGIVPERIARFQDSEFALAEDIISEGKKQTAYWGPHFRDLDESLQDAYDAYLVSRGIDSKLGDAVLALASEVERKAYVKSLKDIKDFFQA